MKNKIILMLGLFLLILPACLFGAEKALYVSYPILPDSAEVKGTIYIRDVKNMRERGRYKRDKYFIGQFTRGFGMEPVVSDVSIKNLIGGATTEALEYVGYKVADQHAATMPVMDILILKMETEMPYMYPISIRVKLYAPDGKKLLFRKTLHYYTGMGWGINEVFKAFTRAMNKTQVNLVTLFNSDDFAKSCNGAEFNEKEAMITRREERLNEIPAGLSASLRWADFYSNKINAISNLSTLTALEYLSLYENNIAKIAGLDKLIKLKSLNLISNDITKIGGVNTLTALYNLDLANNEITKIENLEALTNVTWLDLSFNKITKIEGLDALKNITGLNLANNQIAKIENLGTLSNLVVLNLCNNSIVKIANLSGLNNLYYLNLARNADLMNIKNLEGLPNLRVLDLSSTGVAQLENLDKLPSLENLILYKTTIKRIENIEKLTSLKRLWVPESVKTISQSAFDFLKKNDVKVNGANVEVYIDANWVKIKD